MSRNIKVTDQTFADILAEFQNLLTSGRFKDGTVSFSKTIGKIDKKTTLYFTEVAWIKMRMLVDSFDKEVGWRGTAYKQEDGYLITDIFVYPQFVTGATVDTDDDKFPQWLMEFDDETFSHLRFHGHSHVDLAPSPSGPDETHRKEILEGMGDDTFFIFMIMNKKGSYTAKIYDLEDNICYDDTDIQVKYIPDGTGIMDFVSKAKDTVKTKTYTAPSYTNAKTNYAAATTTKNDNKPTYTYGTKQKTPATYPPYYGWDEDDYDYFYKRGEWK